MGLEVERIKNKRLVLGDPCFRDILRHAFPFMSLTIQMQAHFLHVTPWLGPWLPLETWGLASLAWPVKASQRQDLFLPHLLDRLSSGPCLLLDPRTWMALPFPWVVGRGSPSSAPQHTELSAPTTSLNLIFLASQPSSI